MTIDLIVDAGSTKTDWCFCNGAEILKNVRTQGINPCHQDAATITGIIRDELLSSTGEINPGDVCHVFYYGSGCATPSICDGTAHLLNGYFSHAVTSVHSDMLGAARALCGNTEGIACVLGTGSNSCIYDGRDIIDQVPSLGYILGDEGSSSALGKRLISDCLKRQLPDSITKELTERYDLTADSVIENVYRKPMGNRYMADFVIFLIEKRSNDHIHALLVSCFQDFFRRNVISYHRPWLPVNVVGSLAETFSAELSEAAESVGMSIGKILKSPIEGLVKYHSEN